MSKLMSPDVSGRKGVFVMLRIGMPLGTNDRMSVIQLGD